jgi:hypothetical protein
MRRTLVAGLFLATVAASGTAQAGWQKTKWGMTPEQVEAIYGKSLRPLSSDDQESAKHLSDTHVPCRMSYATEDFHFDVRFAFDPSDRLAAVYLFDTPPSCAPLTKAFHGGIPILCEERVVQRQVRVTGAEAYRFVRVLNRSCGATHNVAVLALNEHEVEARELMGRYHSFDDGRPKTIAQWKLALRTLSEHPTWLATGERLYAGLRKAGMPEE